MGTLKRFSYDNIVIHDPTAPDPVEGGGGSGGGGLFFIALTTEGDGVYSINCTYSDIINAIDNGQLPVVIKDGGMWLYLAKKFAISFPDAPPAQVDFYNIGGIDQDGKVRVNRCSIDETNAIKYERS